MNIKDVVKVIQASECAQIATFGKDETEGFPEIRALLNLANPKQYPKLKGKAISVDGETITIYFTTNTSSRKIKQIRANIGTMEEVLDMDVKKDFWHKTWLMYYHKGPADPDYTLMKFTSKYMHCWGNLGIHNFGQPVNPCDK